MEKFWKHLEGEPYLSSELGLYVVGQRSNLPESRSVDRKANVENVVQAESIFCHEAESSSN